MSKNQKRNDGLFDTAIVQKRNVLNELRKNSMSLQELRFFSIYLSKHQFPSFQKVKVLINRKNQR